MVSKTTASVVDVDVVFTSRQHPEDVVSPCGLVHGELDLLLDVVEHELGVPAFGVDADERDVVKTMALELQQKFVEVDGLLNAVRSACL